MSRRSWVFGKAEVDAATAYAKLLMASNEPGGMIIYHDQLKDERTSTLAEIASKYTTDKKRASTVTLSTMSRSSAAPAGPSVVGIGNRW